MINQIKTILLLGLLTGIILLIGAFIAGQQGLLIALIISLLFNLITYFFSDKIVLKMYRAKELPKSKAHKLHSIIEDICKSRTYKKS